MGSHGGAAVLERASIDPPRQQPVFGGHRLSYGAQPLSLALFELTPELFLPRVAPHFHIEVLRGPAVGQNFACVP